MQMHRSEERRTRSSADDRAFSACLAAMAILVAVLALDTVGEDAGTSEIASAPASAVQSRSAVVSGTPDGPAKPAARMAGDSRRTRAS